MTRFRRRDGGRELRRARRARARAERRRQNAISRSRKIGMSGQQIAPTRSVASEMDDELEAVGKLICHALAGPHVEHQQQRSRAFDPVEQLLPRQRHVAGRRAFRRRRARAAFRVRAGAKLVERELSPHDPA